MREFDSGRMMRLLAQSRTAVRAAPAPLVGARMVAARTMGASLALALSSPFIFSPEPSSLWSARPSLPRWTHHTRTARAATGQLEAEKPAEKPMYEYAGVNKDWNSSAHTIVLATTSLTHWPAFV